MESSKKERSRVMAAPVTSKRQDGKFSKGRTDPSRPPKSKIARPPPVQFYIPLNIALCLLLVSHALSALYAPMLDCDETYNYWEPLHYLTHGQGFQTWEYSPEFSIRSWAYILIHALPTKLTSFFNPSKSVEFYALRLLLGAVCAATETRLYSAISRTLDPRIAIFYLLITLTSTGIFYASTSFLPSSFAMYTSTLGLTSFMDWHSGPRTASGIMWFGIGALLGWPFAGALILPFVLEEWSIALFTGDAFDTFRRYLDGIVRCLIVLALQVSIDTFFYRKLVIIPWRIVSYNVFGGKDRGPDIFGTEPWHFYARNLLLNFNLSFILALLSFPLLIIQILFLHRQTTKQTLLRTTTFLAPFYLWLAIFTLQPHKEERFMYPAYPFLALNASIAAHMLLTWLGHSPSPSLLGRIPASLKLAFILPILLGSLLLSLLRTTGTVSAYATPLTLYTHLRTTNSLCLGKDWYRFPTTFLLPPHTTAHFIKSSFSGLLPGEFSPASGPGLFPGAHLIPPGMNDLNQFDAGKVMDVRHCDYLVDTYFAGTEATEEEPLYIDDAENWETVKCEPFLDAASTSFLGRILWLPGASIIPERYRRRWGRHCLLRRRAET